MDEDNGSSTKVIRDYSVSDGILKHADTTRLRPSHQFEALNALRARYLDEGYIFVKRLVPPEFIEELCERCSFRSSGRQDSQMEVEEDASRVDVQTIPLLFNFVQALTIGRLDLNTAPQLPDLACASHHPLRAWLSLTNFHPQGGGPIFLQRCEKAGNIDGSTRNALITEDSSFLKPLQLAKSPGRRWMVAPYEAGDVVIYDEDIVRTRKVSV